MKNITIVNRIRMIAIGIVVVFALFILFYLLPSQSRNIENQVEAKLQNLVETQVKVLSYYYDLSQAGTLTETEAKEAAMAVIGAARYNTNDYFWVNDEKATIILHPIKPELNNTDQSQMKDENGVRIFQTFADTAKGGKDGFVSYMWPKSKDEKPTPKLSYVKGFAPWGYVVGTGIWVDNLTTIKNGTRNLTLIVMGVLIVLVSIAVYILQNIIKKTLNEITTKAQAYGQLDYRENIAIHSGDELGKISTAFNHSVDNLRNIVTDIVGFNHTLSDNSHTLSDLTTALANNSEQTNHASKDINLVIQQATTSTAHIAELIEEVRDAVESIAIRATEGATTTHDVSERATQLQDDANASSLSAHTLYNDVRGQLAQAIDDSKAVQEINTLATAILDITARTNLLALNASIEAARAGDAGRGFAVVASEIGQLAAQSSATASSIRGTVSLVNDSVSRLASSGNSLLGFIDSQVLTDYKKLIDTSKQYHHDADTFNGIMMDLSASSEELNASMDAIQTIVDELSTTAFKGSQGVSSIQDMNQNLSADAEQVATVNQDMKHIIENLTAMIQKIKY